MSEIQHKRLQLQRIAYPSKIVIIIEVECSSFSHIQLQIQMVTSIKHFFFPYLKGETFGELPLKVTRSKLNANLEFMGNSLSFSSYAFLEVVKGRFFFQQKKNCLSKE